MHRENILILLEEYLQRHPEESACYQQLKAFIQQNNQCFERELSQGHLTGSCWLVNSNGDQILLTHHKKLNLWLQPGGHADGETDIAAVALKEAKEESGLKDLKIADPHIFDIDIHKIPANPKDAEHYHYDIRFIIQASEDTDYIVSEESHDLAWVKLDKLSEYTTEPSIVRMAEKWNTRQFG
ncbi:MAG: NUDIX hydrolase [bacterium]